MTGLLIAAGLALIVGIGIMLGARLPLRQAAPVATALLLGLAGYAWQGSPGLADKPVAANDSRVKFDEALAKKRSEIGERLTGATKWLVVSDALARKGNTAGAANVLLSGLREYPDDANIWVGLGNALVAHGNGTLTPAADYAFAQALHFQPEGVSPNYFYGLALAESGQFDRARDVWLKLAARLPEDFELREELIRNVALLNALIERRDAMAQGGPSQGDAPQAGAPQSGNAGP
ncbi:MULTISPECIES: tetratricopeptide repeat protein [Sphingobium]|uniref:tetratricopeptide repeat protein n=1 Tax=Sphingobium TaxID=165695 RepID=UPI0015EBFAE5|nr:MULTISPECIES: cytochrome C biosynthesis protein [Sphingobium]MCW2362407.1 cytochrome c-type biogenesis protein CcmH/NrfG [Sphingobium sp. B10D3B]MCW2400914.1 cytochrome c-type biogenesis protein CcmH/NrfG [Sphingobium sp. B10D7B]MCW2407893.1 cytochrome c-type biogenesis protein CcmH/NrfG [Sphingobium xanthum]